MCLEFHRRGFVFSNCPHHEFSAAFCVTFESIEVIETIISHKMATLLRDFSTPNTKYLVFFSSCIQNLINSSSCFLSILSQTHFLSVSWIFLLINLHFLQQFSPPVPVSSPFSILFNPPPPPPFDPVPEPDPVPQQLPYYRPLSRAGPPEQNPFPYPAIPSEPTLQFRSYTPQPIPNLNNNHHKTSQIPVSSNSSYRGPVSPPPLSPSPSLQALHEAVFSPPPPPVDRPLFTQEITQSESSLWPFSSVWIDLNEPIVQKKDCIWKKKIDCISLQIQWSRQVPRMDNGRWELRWAT